MITKTQFNEIKLEKVTYSRKDLLKNLMSLYLHELSLYSKDLDISNDGFFEYDGLDLFWEKEELIPLVIYSADNIVGFILLTSPPYAPKDIDICIHEFFILNKYRKQGIGTNAINKVMKKYKGKYYITQLENNKPAVQFWQKYYKMNSIEYSEEQITTEYGDKCITQIFSV